MRAAQWTAPPIHSSLKVNSAAPLPKNAHALPKNSALIKVAYVSLNPVDYKLPEVSLARAATLGKAPWIPGSDFSGTVIASNLSHIKPGDHVAGNTGAKFGTLAEYIVVEGVELVAKIPDGASLEDASTLPCAAQTAMQCTDPFVKEGAHVLINGASGGTGVFGIQVAKNLGCKVTAICSGANAALVKELGADEVIDYRSVDTVTELKKGGLKYDLIVDNVTVGGPIYAQSKHYLKETGRYVSIAGAPNLDTLTGYLKMSYQPSWLGGAGRKSTFILRKDDHKELAKLASWLAEGKLKTIIEKVYTLEESAEAFERLRSGRTRGKLVIKVAE